MDDRFRIGLRLKPVTQVNQLLPQVLKVIDFAIEDEPDSLVFIAHGLMSRRRQVNNGKPAKIERDETTCLRQGKHLAAGIVGTAMLDCASALEGGGLVRDLSVESAHSCAPLAGCLSRNAGHGAFRRARNSV